MIRNEEEKTYRPSTRKRLMILDKSKQFTYKMHWKVIHKYNDNFSFSMFLIVNSHTIVYVNFLHHA